MELLQLRPTKTTHDIILRGMTLNLQIARYKDAMVVQYVYRPKDDQIPAMIKGLPKPVQEQMLQKPVAQAIIPTTFWKELPFRIMRVSRKKRIERAIHHLKTEIKKLEEDMRVFDALANEVTGQELPSSLDFS